MVNTVKNYAVIEETFSTNNYGRLLDVDAEFLVVRI